MLLNRPEVGLIRLQILGFLTRRPLLIRLFYTNKPVRSQLGTPGDFTVLSQVSRVKPMGSNPPTMGHWRMRDGMCTGSRPLKNHLHTPECFDFFMKEDTRMQE